MHYIATCRCVCPIVFTANTLSQIHLNVSMEESGGLEMSEDDETRRNLLLEVALQFIGSIGSLLARATDAELQ